MTVLAVGKTESVLRIGIYAAKSDMIRVAAAVKNMTLNKMKQSNGIV